MEILSTGEKIKRIRVYNGVTLKELCGDKISISKMSCIENGKIEADDAILEYISEKLNIDFVYLAKSVYEQIEDNVKLIETNLNGKNYEKELKFNLEYAVEYGNISQSIRIVNKLFKYYKKNKKWNSISDIVPVYYDLYSKAENVEDRLVYLYDLGSYLFQNEEFEEAKVYFKRIKECMEKNNLQEEEFFVKICLEIAKCLMKIEKNEEAEEYINLAVTKINNIKTEDIVCELYHVSTIKNIIMKQYSKDNKEKAYELAKDDVYKLVKMKIDYVKAYFRAFNEREARIVIDEIIEIMPKENNEKCAEEFVKFLKILKQYNQLDYIKKIIEIALNIAIVTDDVTLIEFSYYLKGCLLEEAKKYDEAEMNLNLSLDALTRFGTKRDFYNRYLDLGNLYHKLGNIKESVRYFCLAMDIKKKCNC
ncbi:transcriptional regulator [uncultured Clostridium sp.]|uniref:transcriptional regulator n=1 Tax=uncultured Clostridium sp. TaxID=59620 RepID=UPI0026212CED|nr:transcriptional regulator [uncultured Clostridium sp.]